MTWLAVLLALGSALTVGLSTSVQHRAAGEAPASITGGAGLIAHLARRRVWWFGQLLGFAALVFHALALASGPIALVQPIAIMGMVFAPPIRAAMSHRRLPRPEAQAVVAAFVGLVVFLLATAPRESDVTAGAGTLTMIAVVALTSGALVTAAGRVPDLTVRAFLLGCAAGLLFGSVAVALKIAMHELSDHGVATTLSASRCSYSPYPGSDQLLICRPSTDRHATQ